MMQLENIGFYFSKEEQLEINQFIDSKHELKNITVAHQRKLYISAIKLYLLYLDIYHESKNINTSLKNKLFNEENFNIFSGFVLEEFQASISRKSILINLVNTIFKIIPEKYFTKSSTFKINKYYLENIDKYKKIRRNIPEIYQSKPVTTIEGHVYFLNLTEVYELYGKNHQEKLYNALIRIAKKTKKTTFSRIITNTNQLYNTLFKICRNIDELSYKIRPDNSFQTMYDVYLLMLLNNIEKNYSLINFHQRWTAIVDTFYKLTEYNHFPKPDIDILRPVFKNSKLKTHHLVKSGEIINDKLLFEIPLHLKDDQAKEEIIIRINSTIDKTYEIVNLNISENYYKYKKYQENIKNSFSKIEQGNSRNAIIQYIENMHNNDQTKIKDNHLKTIRENIFLTDYEVLYPLLTKLVLEHPQITASWLIEWKLYENNKLFGYIKTDQVSYIISHKHRKRKKSLQKILLNTESIKVVEQIIELTQNNRSILKKLSDPNWEYMLLIKNSILQIPKRIIKIDNPSTFADRFFLYEIFKRHIDIKKLSETETSFVNELYKNFTLTKLRATVAVKIFLDTNSITIMSEALGHETLDHRLINTYLPEPLWDFFSNRWIRIFQNQIIFESMKDSELIFNAMDINEDNIEEFLRNHKIENLPKYLESISKEKTNNINNHFDLGIFLISVPLLQLLLGIINLNLSGKINNTFKKWLESSNFIISQIKLSLDPNNRGTSLYIDQEIQEMYKLALMNPLNLSDKLK
ncbi:hypothetical protein DJ533_01430 (plasmid) [Acinetobacter defluvii]|uniref:Uncharacterized protein n=1 Tax=Acinetobacter defluvii TaxID=1871111 RepID=A0A2S2F8Y2_9GAMM|nr:hypothetical protein [Acinetobacter defluvii]AWL27358.1 hypothetical protein DJ533_01430 [Acinetobacter defluvii]